MSKRKYTKHICGNCTMYEQGGWCIFKEEKVRYHDRGCVDYDMVNG